MRAPRFTARNRVQTVKKIAFLPYCMCRGDHWLPATLPQQRIFWDSLLTRQTGRGEHCSPLLEFFDSLTESTYLSILVAILGLHLFVTYNLCFFLYSKKQQPAYCRLLLSLSKNTPPKAFATAKAFGIIEENHLGRPPHGKARRRRPPQSNGY